MYAPRQYRPEKKKPSSRFLTLADLEHHGPIMVPPVYSEFEEEKEQENEEKDKKAEGKETAKDTNSQQNAVNKKKDEDESESSESEASETATAETSAPKQLKAIGRSENPPQFKIAAGAPFQFKWSDAPLQMKEGNASGGGSGASGGIPDHVKGQMEGAFGTSFDDVKVTANSSAAASAGALAYAQGNNIHFAPGQFNPESKGGQELIGHELAHVVQQREGRVQANAQVGGMAVNNDKGLEAEADQMGAKAAQFKADPSAAPKSNAGSTSNGPAQMKMDPNAQPKPEEKDKDKETDKKGELQNEGEHDERFALDGFAPIKKEEEGNEDESEESKNHPAGEVTAKDNGAAGDSESNETENEGPADDQEKQSEELTANTPTDEAAGIDAKGDNSTEREAPEAETEDPEALKTAETDPNAAKESEAPAAKGEGGGEGGAGGGGESRGGAGGGADSSGGDAAGGGGGGDGAIVPPQLEQIPVADAERGNFGAGEEPSLMLVNEGALKEFDPELILNKNADGSAIVLAGSVPATKPGSEPPVQMQGDPTKKVPLKKAVSADQSKALFSTNREKTKAYLTEFEANAKSKIETLESAKSGIAAQLQAGASSAKSSIMSAAAAEKGRVEAGFEALKAAMLAAAERVKGETRSAAETAKAAVQSAADTAKANVEAEFLIQDAAFVALEPDMKAKFTAAFDKGRADMITAAEELGLKAHERGEVKAAEFDAIAIPSQSWDEDLLNGSEYEKDRHKARVNAAREVAKGYKEQFLQKAKEEGDNLKASGETEIHNYITTSVQQSREAIAQRKQAALDNITAHAEGAISSITSNCDATIAGIEAGAQAGVTALDGQKVQAVGQVETTAQGKCQAVDATAQEKTLNLELQVQSAIDALNSQVNTTVTKVSARKNPNAESVRAQLQSTMASIQSGVDQGMKLAVGGAEVTAEGMNQTATETAAELSTAVTSHLDGGSQTKDAMVANFEGQRDSFVTGAQSIQDASTKSMTEAAESAAKDMKDQYDAVKKDLDDALGKLEGKMTENSSAFKANIQQQLDGIDKEIDTKAQEAYDAVQPRWVAWLLTAIDILVVILVTAVVCLAVASGVGILGLLLIGAAAGAVGGAIKYGARVGLTSEEFNAGKFGNAVLGGAVDGLNIAVGLIPGLGPVASVLSQVGMGALGGAIKYGGDVLLEGKKFSWGTLAGKTFLGGFEGAIGFIGGKAGDGVGNFLTKKLVGEGVETIGKKILIDIGKTGTEAFFDTVNGGVQNMVDSYLETGTLDFGKFTEKFTLQEFATNFATSKVTDIGVGKATDIGKSVLNIPDSPSSGSGSTTTKPDDNSTVKNDPDVVPAKDDGNSTPTPTDTPITNDTPSNKDNDSPVDKVNDTPSDKTNDTPTNKDSDAPITNDGVVNPNVTKKDGDNTTPKDNDAPTNETKTDSDTPTHKGQQQADALGYPKAPDGYQWVAKADGTPYLRRENGRSADLPPVKFDPATGQFKPDVPAPGGYHWQLVDGKFSLHPDPKLADSLPPIQYDPTTGGFKDADGKPFTGDLSGVAVRGTDLAAFTSTVKGLDADPVTAKQAYDLYAKKDWPALEKLFTEKGLNGGWPPNRGFIDIKDGVLPVGATFDRFGGYKDDSGTFQDKGTFVAPYGADFDGRALPDDTKNKPLNGYEVIKPIPMKEGDAIPWFGKPGGGKQYELSMGINDLIAGGYIKKIDAPDLSKPVDKTNGTDVDPSKTNTTPDPTKTDGDNTDGGGMKGKDVYPTAPEGQRVSDMTPAEVAKAVQDAAGRKGRLPEGAKVTPTDKPGKFTMTYPDPANPKKTKSIELVVNTNFDPTKAKTGHGADQGAAMNTVTVKDGKITATVELGGNHNKADVDKMMMHELGEIADIVAQVEARKAEDAKNGKTSTDADLQKLISEQQQASVFKDGGSAKESDMTAHDRAVVAEIDALVDNVKNAADATEAKAATDKLRKLAESMGIKGPDDPRIALIEKTTGRLNGEQLAAISGMPNAPAGYTWIRGGDGTMTVENLPGNDGPILDYKPGANPPFEKSKTSRPKPENLAVESKNQWQLGTTKSADNGDGVHSIEVKHSDLSPADQKRLSDLQAVRDAAKKKKDTAPNEDAKGDAHGELVRASEALGDAATDIAMSTMLPNATQLPSDIPGDGKSGQFDRVYQDGDTIYVVESKGGGSELGSRKDLNGQQSQQGTPEYIASVISNMADKVKAGKNDPRYGVDDAFTKQIKDLDKTVKALQKAQSSTPSKIVSLQVSQRVDADGNLVPSFEVNKFENQSVKAPVAPTAP
jgi:hypothetical protein